MKFLSLTKIVLPLALVAGAVYYLTSSTDPNERVGTQSVGTVHKQDLTQRVTISGQVYPKRRLDVKTPYTGYVRKLYVRIGDRVKINDPLITFSPSLGDSETNYPIRAAFNGVVTQVQMQEGEYVLSTDTTIVLRVDDLSELFVQASVPELDVAKIKIGQEAAIKVSALLGENFKGVITETALASKEKSTGDRWGSSSAEYQIKTLIKGKHPDLLPGMSALMDVITNKAEGALALPHEYIQQENGQNFVTLLSGEKRPIEIGMQTDEAVQIKSGLKEGDQVQVIDFMSYSTGDDSSSGGRRGGTARPPGGRR